MNPLKMAAMLAVLASASATTALAAPVTYSFDPNHSFVRFGYSHMGFSHQQSQFDKITGSITFDAQAKTGSVDVTIDTTSVDTGSPLFNMHIQGPDYLDTAMYPTATFKSTHVRFKGDEPVSVQGTLTLKGVTHPVTLTVEHFKAGMNMQKKPALGADAVAHIKRSDFNMGKNAPMVGDDVTVTVDFEAAGHS